MSSKRWFRIPWLGLLFLGLCGLLLVWTQWFLPELGGHSAGNKAGPEGDQLANQVHFPAPQSASVRLNARAIRSDVETEALARAVAIVGQIADGALVAIPADLDPATQAALAEAKALLAAQQPQRRAGLAFQAADGSTMRIAPPAAGTAAAAAFADLDPAEPVVARTDAGTAQAAGAVSAEADGAAVAGDGVWSAIWREPGEAPFHLREITPNSHAIRLHPEDPGTLRVNGGLVVPGRCYRVGSGLVIESAGKIGIDIVPLDAAPLVYDGPIPLSPAGAG